jgi:hypothetical protein
MRSLFLLLLTKSAASSVKPFFLSALNHALTDEEAVYIGRFPLAIINHKQGGDPEYAEGKQISALAAIKTANTSCQTHFYLNSLIDFPALALHSKCAAAPNGSWWMKEDNGDFVMHKNDHIFDVSIAAVRDAWISTAVSALSNDSVDGIFIDKADGEGFAGVSKARMAQWNNGHSMLLSQLRNSTSKNIILNNVHDLDKGMGQLFERWGAKLDHDRLNIVQDIALVGKLNAANLTVLARAGGVAPGSGGLPDPVACGAGLAAFLVAQHLQETSDSFFSCMVDFSSSPGKGWMTLLEDSIYSHLLGHPRTKAVVVNGLLRRQFVDNIEGKNVITATVWLNESAPNLGCVQWKGGAVSGTCPPGVPSFSQH